MRGETWYGRRWQGKPWLLLVPNFVYTKDYYQRTALSTPGTAALKPPMYLVPNKRYTYWTPPWLHQTKFGASTSPFPSFWFLQARLPAGPCLADASPQMSRASTDVLRVRLVDLLRVRLVS